MKTLSFTTLKHTIKVATTSVIEGKRNTVAKIKKATAKRLHQIAEKLS